MQEASTRTLLAIKKVQLARRHTASLDFNLPQGKHDLTIAVVCDSYMGVDRVRRTHSGSISSAQEYSLSVDVAAGQPSDDEDDDDAMSE